MKLVIVKGNVSGIGIRVHTLRAADKTEAWGKFCRAYSKHECAFVSVISAATRKPVWTGARV